MESQNKYIGDESFKKFLGHYGCPTPLPVVKMKFAGAVCSPNLDLRPADVISSFWPAGQAPRLETKNEADLFFKFFRLFFIISIALLNQITQGLNRFCVRCFIHKGVMCC